MIIHCLSLQLWAYSVNFVLGYEIHFHYSLTTLIECWKHGCNYLVVSICRIMPELYLWFYRSYWLNIGLLLCIIHYLCFTIVLKSCSLPSNLGFGIRSLYHNFYYWSNFIMDMLKGQIPWVCLCTTLVEFILRFVIHLFISFWLCCRDVF